MNRINKKVGSVQMIILIVVVALAAGFLGYSLAGDNNNQPNENKASITTPAYGKITYPDNWQETNMITTRENQAGVISRATLDSPASTANVRVEAGELAKDFDINSLPDEIEKSLKSELEGLEVESKTVVKAGKHDSVQIRYKQEGSKYLMAIIPTSSKSYYLTIKTDSPDFEVIAADSNQIITSLAAYIDSSSN